MEADQDKPIAREPWQRLLRERYDAPPELTDARIRAAARRAYKSRAARWYLPVSLAASFLLAVMLVQWQFGGDNRPAVVTESDVVAPMILTPSADAPEQAIDSTGRATAEELVPESRPAPASAAAVAPADLSAPLIDLPAAPAPAQEAALERESAGLSETRANTKQSAPTRAEPSSEFSKLGALRKSDAESRAPEEWYAAIEVLRAAGRIEEADTELARLEAAWPGWLEKNHPQGR